MKLMKVLFACGAMIASAMTTTAFAKTCEFTIEGNDSMQFNLKEIKATDCKDVKLTLKHVGKMPKAAMGHNWVLSETKDMQGIVGDSGKAGPSKDYTPSTPSVIAKTRLLAGGESDTVTFSTAKLKKGGDYSFFCTFPGHSALMKGKFVF